MKKYFTHISTTILTVIMALCFSSCDNDTDIAYDLNGIWYGTIEGNYYYDRYGTLYTTTWETRIQFVQSGNFSNGGYGTEEDYNQSTGGNTSSFTWKVNNGRIYMSYDDDYQIVINNYDLYTSVSRSYFMGYFLDWDTGEQLASFNLLKVNSWRNGAKPNTATPSLEE